MVLEDGGPLAAASLRTQYADFTVRNVLQTLDMPALMCHRSNA